MLHALARNWLAIVLRGVAAIIFGVLAFAMPGVTLLFLVTLFGVYALFDGVINLIGAFRAGVGQHWTLFFEGVIGVLAGIAALIWPHITIFILIYLVGFWAIFTGVLEVASAIRLWRQLGSEWLLLLSGVASLLFGFFVMAVPLAGAIAVAVWIGAYALLFGVLLVLFGIRLRRVARRHPNLPGETLVV